MKPLLSFLFWSLVFFLAAVGLDQFFVRVEMRRPVLVEVRTFYVDFRARLLRQMAGFPNIDVPFTQKQLLPTMPKNFSADDNPTVAVDGKQPKSVATLPVSVASESNPRYLYSDDKGNLLFVDRLEDIPSADRGAAQPLAR